MALALLHEVFPHLSLQSIAEAYDASGGSVDAAAEALHQRSQILEDEKISKKMQRAEEELQQLKAEAGAGKQLAPKPEGGEWVAVRAKPGASEPDKKLKKKRHRKKRSRDASEEPKPEELEEYLESRLGSEAKIGRDVIRDIISHFGGNVQKCLDCLALLTGQSSITGTMLEKNGASNSENEAVKSLGCEENHTTKGKESSYQILSNQVHDQENFPPQDDLTNLSRLFPGISIKALDEILKASAYDYSAAVSYLAEAGLEPAAADPPHGQREEDQKWQLVKPKPRPEKKKNPSPAETMKPASAPPDEWGSYDRHYESFLENRSKMKQFFSQAAVAQSNGHRNQAAYLSQKCQEFKHLAREARARASDDVFRLRNKQQENNITIDLHNQHVDEALKLLSLHLKTLAVLPSVHTLTVITGSGNHAPNGKPKLKPIIISFMKARKLVWSELNPGCLQVNLQSVN